MDFQRLDSELDAVCKRGYAFEFREASENSGCIAFPVVARGNVVSAAISVSTTPARLEHERDYLISTLSESAEFLSYNLGFIGCYPYIRPQGYQSADRW